MRPDDRRPSAWLALLAGLAIVAGLGCDRTTDPGVAPAYRETRSVGFDEAIRAGRAERRSYSLGSVHRVFVHAPHASARGASTEFLSDPIEFEPGDHLLLGMGLLGIEGPLSESDRPRFLVDAVGHGREVRLAERTGQDDIAIDGWAPMRVALPPDLEAPIRLRMRIERTPPADPDAPRAIPLWSVPRLVRSTTTPRPNVLFVVFDTLRADHTQPYGYPRETTPFLSELAARGTLVEDVVATYPTTLSSHWSMFTGLFPARHGVYPGFGPSRAPAKPLAEYFQESGYRTAAFTEGGFVHSLFGFSRGFDHYDDGPTKDIHDLSGSAARTFTKALDWLTGASEEPYFLFLHTYEVHTPYQALDRFRDLFVDEYDGRWSESFPSLANFIVNNGTTELTPAEKQHIVDLYDAGIRQLDELFSRLWKRLEARGLLRDTIVVITSDHGEDLFEHGWLNHGTTLHDPGLMVPLVFIAPERVATGARLACQWSQPDLLPTILDLVGIPGPSDADGRSRAAELRRGECSDDSAAFSELVSSPFEMADDLPMASLRKGGWKLIRHLRTGELEAFDLRDDPGEQQDASDAVDPALIRELDDYVRSRPDLLEEDAGEIPAEVRDRLKALGYAE